MHRPNPQPVMPPASIPMMRAGRVGMLLIAAFLFWLAAAPVAHGQEYAQESGELELESSLVVTVSGDGFVRLSVVYLTLVVEDPANTDEEFDLGTLDTDEIGAFAGTLQLPESLAAGTYVMTATGVTDDGATRVLTAEFVIGDPATAAAEETAETTPTTAGAATTTSSTEAAPATTLVAGDSDEPNSNATRLLLSRVVLAAVLLLGGVWWWLYRAVHR